MSHDEMIAAAKVELESQYKQIAAAMGISENEAKSAWIKSATAEYHRLIRNYNGMPKSWTMPLDQSAYLIALGQIVNIQRCGDCKNFKRCEYLFQCNQLSTCDFEPSRYSHA